MASDIYRFSSVGTLSKDFDLRGQMRSAAVSVPSNIAEGFERGTTPQFIQFLFNARGSAGELRTQLYIALDNHDVDGVKTKELLAEIEEISRMIFGFIKSLEEQKSKQ